MNSDLDRASLDLMRAWLSAQQIGQDVDKNLRECLVNLSSGLLALANANASNAVEAASTPTKTSPVNSHIRTRTGVGIQFTDR